MTSPPTTKSNAKHRIDGSGDNNQYNNNNNNIGGNHRGSRMGETAGECAAVCCCCPCAMIHLLILAVYRLPAGLWRKRKRKRLLKQKKRKNSENPAKKKSGFQVDLGENDESTKVGDCSNNNHGEKIETLDWDREMWDRFYGAGFWRSTSRRDGD
ncbi:Hypothetical predicted protein [Olea europaea subsp. europaea]|uniref:Pollen preferential protein n=1 Tax=Olea europaea subsp. europaea TaxID=158383 RepID=A0A8S0QUA9_OLEEU|nr:Hypothetical predicted protein [Olea europaea subsp. europaea]